MRTLKIIIAAAVLLVGTSASATHIVLNVHDENDQNSGLGVGLHVDLVLNGVPGGGLGSLNFDVEIDGAGTLSNFVGSGFSTLAYSGNANGTNQLWDDGVAGPINGLFLNIVTFDLTGGAAGTEIDLRYPDTVPGGSDAPLFAYLDDFSVFYDIQVNPYTVIPEPTTAALLGLGLFGLALGGRRR